jgi:CheY-like chemotaxis protein
MSIRLVLVEDDQLVRGSASMFFEGAGWTVTLAADAPAAMACLTAPFDVMVCDLHLSALRAAEGLKVLAAARRAAPKAVLVLLSGEGTGDLDSSPADAVLQKPIRLPQLRELLTELLARRAG